MLAEAYEHINLNDVDTTMKPIPANVYNLEVNKLEPVRRVVKNPNSALVGQSCLVLKGSFTVVESDTYSGRKLWQDFWIPFEGARKDLRRLMDATAATQPEGMDLETWAAQFATFNPPAKFQVQVTLDTPKNDPTGTPVNRINFTQAKAI